MFGPRSPRYPILRAYLQSRPVTPVRPTADRASLSTAAALAAGSLAVVFAASHWALLGLILAGCAGGLGFKAWRAAPKALPSPEEELSRRADRVAHELVQFAYLHRAFHPGVGAVLEECAGYHARIVDALGTGDWGMRGGLRDDVLAAAKVAMDEALVHAGATLDRTPPPRPLEHVSDALEDVGFAPLVRDARREEPMPAAFRPVRALAERLRELAERSETAARQKREEGDEPVSAAFRRLDAALGQMRQVEEAERELRQGA